MRTCFITALVLTLGFTVAQRGFGEDPQIVKPDYLFIVDARRKVIARLEAVTFANKLFSSKKETIYSLLVRLREDYDSAGS